MKIAKITCSDLQEHNHIDGVLELLSISQLVELGIQAHDDAMNRGLPRYEWFSNLLRISEESPRPLNIAAHVNGEWCEDFCNGLITPELEYFLESRNKATGEYSIRRWQLNIIGGVCDITPDLAAGVLDRFPGREFIFPYNGGTKSFIYDLKMTFAKFSLLFDNSYGVGASPEKWEPPVFDDVPQGYAGGLCAENLAQNLDKIAAVVPKDRSIWIDAEGRLMKPHSRIFDMGRAAAYVRAALNWINRSK